MPEDAALRQEVAAFFATYGSAFERYDVGAIADQYAYPAHLTNDTGRVILIAATTRDEWMKLIDQLLESYRRLGVRSARVTALDVAELSPRLARATVTWALHDAADALIFDFDTTYLLGRFDEGLRITSVAVHNEVPQARVAAESRGAARAVRRQ